MKKLIRKIVRKLHGEQDINKLIRRGLTVGPDFKCMEGVIIDSSHCWHITIGKNVTLAPRVHILAHDASTKVFLDYTRVSNVKIGDNVFVGAGSIILPGVTIGSNVVIGSGSVVVKNIPDNSVAVGNPAKVVKSLNAFLEEKKQEMKHEVVFGEEFTLRNPNFGEEERKKLKKEVETYGKVFVY